MKQRFNGQRNATPCGSTGNRKRNKTASLLHPFKNGAGKLLLILSLLLASVGAWADDYVFMKGNYFLGSSTTATTNFVPNASIYTGTSGGTFRNKDGYYIRYSNNNGLQITTSNYSNLTISNNNELYLYANRTVCYLNLNNTTWRLSNNNNRATAYPVTTTIITRHLESMTITGSDRIEGLRSNNNYTHSNTSYISDYTKYEFSNKIYYSTDPANAASTTEPAKQTTGITYTWALEGADGYASVNTTSGVVNYHTLIPERERTITLKCIAKHTSSGVTTTATKEITLVNPNALFDPSISYDNAAEGRVSVTLSYPESDSEVKLYYTTNGDTPSSSSNEYTGSFEVASGTTIKVIAVKGSTTSAVVSAVVENITTGVDNGKVVLDDREDHTWTYYQSTENLPAGYPAYLSSPDPRNVKITYRGGSVNNASEVAISGLDGEGQNEMVYYKTLEKTVLGMTGNYPYQVISNPFSKRPRTNGTTGTNGFWGFAGWKVISGGEYIAEHANNDVLGLDEIIHFTNLDYNYTPNCTSGEIVFEATWTAATVKTGTTAQTFTGGTYETNFWVLSGNTAGISIGSPCTVSARNPDGTLAGNYSIGTNNASNIATTVDNVKIEFLNLNTTGTVSAAGYSLTMGRGITWSRTAGQVLLNSGQNRAQTVKIESGAYGGLKHFGTNITTNGNDKLAQKLVLGCDYDRAKNDNLKLRFNAEMIGSRSSGTITASNNHLYEQVFIKSGDFMSTVTSGDPYTGGYAGNGTYYFRGYGNRHRGLCSVTIEGGDFLNICGGTDLNSTTGTARSFHLRVRGTAHIKGVVYGGAENADCHGSRTMIFTGGTVNGWICGAANGTSTSNGNLNGTTYFYIGGNVRVDSENSTRIINKSMGGNVYAAGCGAGGNTSGRVDLGTNLVLADNAYVERGVYGGGAYGYSKTDQTTNIFITGGHLAGKNGATTTTDHGGVFGGACQQAGGTINITMTGGLIEGGLHGGSNTKGTIAKDITMQIDGGQVGTSTTPANIHGGGYGQNTQVSQSVDITLGKAGAAPNADGVVVYGDVYGGSALGKVNGTSATNDYHTNVTMNAGTINGSLYGGGLGDNSYAANVYGPVSVTVNGGVLHSTDQGGLGAVFGCNNRNGSPQGKVTVDVTGGEMEYIYGGGNAAPYTVPTPNSFDVFHVHMSGGLVHKHVFGGGLGANAVLTGNTEVKVTGGSVVEGNVYGGGHGAEVTGDTHVVIGQ